MKRMCVYYAVQIVLQSALLIVFHDCINMHWLSFLPLFLIALIAFQTSFLKNEKREIPEDTAYSVGDSIRLTDEEQQAQYECLKNSFLILIPFEIPFVFFFGVYAKLLSLIPYILAYILGGIAFKIKMGAAIEDRVSFEKMELQKQKEKEEMGLK